MFCVPSRDVRGKMQAPDGTQNCVGKIARMSLGALSSQAVTYAAKCKRRMGLSAER